MLAFIFAQINTMVKRFVTLVCSVMLITFSFSQSSKKSPSLLKPKLVIGLVIDQMRWDYLYRYKELYSSNGFNRLLSQGFSCENTMIPYVPTYTAPGHSCIYTGSVPAINGIAGNNWFEKAINKDVYCTDDSTVSSVGSNSISGKMSPRNLWTTTITDELRLSNNFKSKVIGIALKDRSSILPAGHSANAAYWYDEKTGTWITSSYYMNDLPAWVKAINDKKFPDVSIAKEWNKLLPDKDYELSTADNEAYERGIGAERRITFPHKISPDAAGKYEDFKYTPFAVTYTFNMAKSAVENEQLGCNNVTDFLAVSISSTDYIGHSFGPNSVEVEDTYLRLDKDIADFLKYLDNKLGKETYIIFLTADHGVSHIPTFLQQKNIPSGVFNEGDLMKELNVAIEQKFNIKSVIKSIENYQVYLSDTNLVLQNKLQDVKLFIIQYLKQKTFIVSVFATDKISEASLPEPIKKMVINGYNEQRGGDIQFILKPAYFDGSSTGTTHGSWNPYDAHIPLLWFGWNIKPGQTNRETYMTDIAPTIAAMLKIQMPNGCVGKVIDEVIK